MATAKELGLVDGTNEMMIRLYTISNGYSDGSRWEGFKKFRLYKPESGSTEIMRLLKTSDPLRPPINEVGISVYIIPDLVKLHQTAPDLFEEFILAVLAHEGAKAGHLMLWPIASIDEALKYFNWRQLDNQAVSLLIRNFVKGIWPREILDAGTPPFAQWLPALTIIRETLSRSGYNRVKLEPFGVIWKESQAMYGMFKDRGIRSVAICLWFEKYFRKLNVNVQNEFAVQFDFLDAQQRQQVIAMMSEIQKEYMMPKYSQNVFVANALNK
ncbi:MAG: hypothetical protein WC347_06485 [Smithellaceae bacterium]|jgi:hypothetical protein